MLHITACVIVSILFSALRHKQHTQVWCTISTYFPVVSSTHLVWNGRIAF